MIIRIECIEVILVKDSGLTKRKTQMPANVYFEDVEKKSLGHLYNIIFWNDKQLQVINSLTQGECLIIVGDYGTGKTLLLDAAAWRLEAQQIPVHFICALDYDGAKVNDDVLDILFRLVILLLSD